MGDGKPRRRSGEATRRKFLGLGAAVGGALMACSDSADTPAGGGVKRTGKPPDRYGERSPFEKSVRRGSVSKYPEAGSTRTPLQDSHGIITPSSLHFERHRKGHHARGFPSSIPPSTGCCCTVWWTVR